MIDMSYLYWFVFFFKQKTAYEMRISDWSSDVCSSDLGRVFQELDDLFQLLARFVDARDVGEGDLAFLLRQHPRAAFAETHRARTRILLHLAQHEEGDAEAQPERQRIVEHDRSEEHTSELQSILRTSYAVFFLTKKK